ncbi:hypothetical protein V494_05342 [Pseudogymnoascus sp. VKM F-4513 (FW-928)]|nr:hypothetical protein V494_05342 [Pseudogymnoascus sp. VKM F-4513 (FW-928)]
MDEEEGVSSPSTTTISTPQSSPMYGTDVRPLHGNNRRRSRERMRPSVFQGDGLEAFIEIYGTGEKNPSKEIPKASFFPSPIERYKHWNDEVPWRPSENMHSDVGRGSREEREDERERRLSNVVEGALKVFSSPNEASSQSSNSKSPATVKAIVHDGKEMSPTEETPGSAPVVEKTSEEAMVEGGGELEDSGSD